VSNLGNFKLENNWVMAKSYIQPGDPLYDAVAASAMPIETLRKICEDFPKMSVREAKKNIVAIERQVQAREWKSDEPLPQIVVGVQKKPGYKWVDSSKPLVQLQQEAGN
jgi:hypothetical protein